MPLIRMLDAEEAHNIAVKAASFGLAPKVRKCCGLSCRCYCCERDFRNGVSRAFRESTEERADEASTALAIIVIGEFLWSKHVFFRYGMRGGRRVHVHDCANGIEVV